VDLEHVTPRSVTVKVAVRLFVLSLTVTEWLPRAEEDEIANVQPELMLPVKSVVQVVGIPAVEPSYMTVRPCVTLKP